MKQVSSAGLACRHCDSMKVHYKQLACVQLLEQNVVMVCMQNQQYKLNTTAPFYQWLQWADSQETHLQVYCPVTKAKVVVLCNPNQEFKFST